MSRYLSYLRGIAWEDKRERTLASLNMRFSAYHILWCSESPLFALLFALLSFRIFSQSISGHESIVMCNGGNDLELLPNFIANLLWRMHLCAFVYARAIEETRWKIIWYLSMNKFGIEEREHEEHQPHLFIINNDNSFVSQSISSSAHNTLFTAWFSKAHSISSARIHGVSCSLSWRIRLGWFVFSILSLVVVFLAGFCYSIWMMCNASFTPNMPVFGCQPLDTSRGWRQHFWYTFHHWLILHV